MPKIPRSKYRLIPMSASYCGFDSGRLNLLSSTEHLRPSFFLCTECGAIYEVGVGIAYSPRKKKTKQIKSSQIEPLPVNNQDALKSAILDLVTYEPDCDDDNPFDMTPSPGGEYIKLEAVIDLFSV